MEKNPDRSDLKLSTVNPRHCVKPINFFK